MTWSLVTLAQLPPAKKWFYNKKHEKTGVKLRYSEDGNGLKHGKYIEYYSNGERKVLGHFNHGKKHGKWVVENCYEVFVNVVCYNEIITYQNGIINGEYTKFVKNNSMMDALLTGGGSIQDYSGKYSSHGYYKNGQKTGAWEENFQDEERIYSKGTYVNGKRDGKWINTQQLPNADTYKTIKGSTAYYELGTVIKCIDANGVDLVEQRLFQNCNSITELEELKKKYPNSSFYASAKAKFDEAQRQQDLANQAEELRLKAISGDVSSMREYFGESSSLLSIYKIINSNDISSLNIKEYKFTVYSNRHTNFRKPNKKEYNECLSNLMSKASNSMFQQRYKQWKEQPNSNFLVFSVYTKKSILIVKDYDSNTGYNYLNNKLIDTWTTGSLYKGYWDKTPEQRYLLDFVAFIGRGSIKLETFRDDFTSATSSKEYKEELLLTLKEIVSKNDVRGTPKNSPQGLRTIYLALIEWELGNADEMIDILKNTQEEYQYYQGSWLKGTSREYLKYFIKKYINEEKRLKVREQKELFKLLKKE